MRTRFAPPIDVVFGNDGPFGSLMYFTDFGSSCMCTRTADALGQASAPFATFPETVIDMAFGIGGDFGTDLYVTSAGSLYRVDPLGDWTVFASGFSGRISLVFSGVYFYRIFDGVGTMGGKLALLK